MKILQLCKKFPYPLKDGESIAVTTLSKSLNGLGCEITLLAMNTKKHFFNFHLLPPGFNHYFDIHTVEVDNRIKYFDAFLNLFSKESYHITRFISPAFESKLIRLLKEKEYDLVQLETLYLAPYIPCIRKYSKAVIAMRAHNVEHEIWQRITANTQSLPKKLYLRHLSKKLKRFEVGQLNNYDILVAITRRDLDIFKSLGHKNAAVVTPIGIDDNDYKPSYNSYQGELSLSFIGSLDWMPNLEGLKWFLDKVWGTLHRKFPSLKLHIAGRNTPEWLLKMKKENIIVHGEVPDAIKFINAHPLMIVPLLSGSGMRAKILEGMALGKVILTTRLGLEGINARHRSEVLVANSARQFIDEIAYCFQQGPGIEMIGRQAQEFVAGYYDRDEIAKHLIEAYASLSVEAL